MSSLSSTYYASPIASTSSAASKLSRSDGTTRKAGKARSCDGCRIRKIACSYRAEVRERLNAASANSIAPTSVLSSASASSSQRAPCNACAAKGIPCIVTNEDVPFTRDRTGKNVRKAIAHGAAHASTQISQRTVTGTEEALNIAVLAGRLAHVLIGSCTGLAGMRAIQNRPPLCNPLVGRWSMHERFEAAGSRIDQLNVHDQIQIYIVMALGLRKVHNTDMGPYSRNEAFLKLSSRAHSKADQAGLWRRSDLASTSTLMVLSHMTCDGDLTSRAGTRWFKAAVDSLQDLCASEPAGRIDVYETFIAMFVWDIACALEAQRAPLMPETLLDYFAKITSDMRASGHPYSIAELTGRVLRSIATFTAGFGHEPIASLLPSLANLHVQMDAVGSYLTTAMAACPPLSPNMLYLDIVRSASIAGELAVVRCLEAAAAFQQMDVEAHATLLQHLCVAQERFCKIFIAFACQDANSPTDRNCLALMSGGIWSATTLSEMLVRVQYREDLPACALAWMQDAMQSVAEGYVLPPSQSDPLPAISPGQPYLGHQAAYHPSGPTATSTEAVPRGSHDLPQALTQAGQVVQSRIIWNAPTSTAHWLQ